MEERHEVPKLEPFPDEELTKLSERDNNGPGFGWMSPDTKCNT